MMSLGRFLFCTQWVILGVIPLWSVRTCVKYLPIQVQIKKKRDRSALRGGT